MADTKHHQPSQLPVEGDGIHYGGIVGFVIVLTIVTVTCQLLIWVLLNAFQHQAATANDAAAPLAPAVQRQDVEGRTELTLHQVEGASGTQPRLLTNEPAVLEEFRKREDQSLTTYGWVDQNAGVVRIPIDRAKDLALERGFPVRGK
jgi:hypothetical protein